MSNVFDKLRDWKSAIESLAATIVTLWVLSTWPPESPIWKYLAYYGLIPLVWLWTFVHFAVHTQTWANLSINRKVAATIVMTILFISGIGTLLHFRPVATEGRPVNSGNLQPNAETRQVSIDCHNGFPPAEFPADGRIFLWELYPENFHNDGSTITLSAMTGIGGKKINWGIEWPINHGFMLGSLRCAVTDDMSTAIFDLIMQLRVAFKIPDKSGSTNISFDETAWMTQSVKIAKIDPGPDRPFVFYVLNRSNQLAYLRLPDRSTAEIAGIGGQNVRIKDISTTAQFGVLILPEFHDK